MKFVKLASLAAAAMIVLAGCFISSPAPARPFEVTYSATKSFQGDEARVRYVDRNGDLVTGSFSGTDFRATVSFDGGEQVQLIADQIFGEVTITLEVVRTADDTVEVTQQQVCTTADTNTCRLSTSTPSR